jgi:hypothetical protein
MSSNSPLFRNNSVRRILVAIPNDENATILSSNLELSQRQGHIRDVHSFTCKFILHTKLFLMAEIHLASQYMRANPQGTEHSLL